MWLKCLEITMDTCECLATEIMMKMVQLGKKKSVICIWGDEIQRSHSNHQLERKFRLNHLHIPQSSSGVWCKNSCVNSPFNTQTKQTPVWLYSCFEAGVHLRPPGLSVIGDGMKVTVNLCVFPRLFQPENLLVVHNTSGQPTVKLTDFGDAVQLNSAHYVHPLLGSPEFASPELVLGDPVSLSSDLWSLGVVAYVLLSGASPFLDESAEETCLNICRLDFSFPKDYFQGVSQEARNFVRLLLRTDPGRRRPAGLCLQEPWLQAGQGDGRARAECCLDTSRLISFIDRRKHQTDARPIGGVRSFIQSRLRSQVWTHLPPCCLTDLIITDKSRKRKKESKRSIEFLT